MKREVDDTTILDKFVIDFKSSGKILQIYHCLKTCSYLSWKKQRNRRYWHDYRKAFIDSQLIKANQFYKELSKTKEGKKKIERL